jgi:hypothetical protein
MDICEMNQTGNEQNISSKDRTEIFTRPEFGGKVI